MKFLIKYKVNGEVKEMTIFASDLDEAEEKANAKKLDWIDIIITK